MRDAQEKLYTARLKRSERRGGRALGPALFYQNAIDLPRLSLTEAIKGGKEGAFVPDDRWRTFRRLGPEFVDNPADDRRFDVPDGDIVCPPSFLATSPDALLTGYRTVITPSGKIFNDDCVLPSQIPDFVNKIGNADDFFLNEATGLTAGSDNIELRLTSPDRPAIKVRGSIVLLNSHEPRNYGSLIFRVLPKLYSIKRWGLESHRFLVPKIGSATDELLRLMDVPSHRLIQHKAEYRYRIDHLLVPSERNSQAFLDPETLDLIGSLRERFGKAQQKNKRIYISRHRINQSQRTYRFFSNEDKLIEKLAAMGFEIFCPEQHSIRAQIETLSSASLVVGPSGAGMFNVVFCWPGTKLIDIESEPWWLHAHTCLFSSCRLRYGMVIGRVDPTDGSTFHKRWDVDIDLVCRRIEKFDSAS